jgi:outer membrane protein TolC
MVSHLIIINLQKKKKKLKNKKQIFRAFSAIHVPAVRYIFFCLKKQKKDVATIRVRKPSKSILVMKTIFKIILFLCTTLVWAQDKIPAQLTLDEYLGYIKKYHPVAKQAQLQVSQSQAGIMAARGGFDPKLEVDYNTKQFKSKEYYSILNASFKIPTWYGVEVKAAFDQNQGLFINPEDNLPSNGLATLGISIPLGQGLFINNRMAALKQAKIFNTLTKAQRDIEITNLIYQATAAYINWYKNYQENKLYNTYYDNAKIRFEAIKKLISNGDKPAIDSTEAGIVVKNRALNLEQSRIKLVKSSLELSNFLWLDNNIPFELQDNNIPEENLSQTIVETLKTNGITTIDIQKHPKIVALQNKVNILEIDKKVKGDLLKPRLDFNYNYLSIPTGIQSFNQNNYKYGLNFSYPLFTRKERGNYRMAKFKLETAQLDLDFENLNLKNKIDAQNQEINSLKEQVKIANQLVVDYSTMLKSEERLFFFGESSIFLINSRENSLLTSNLQAIETNIRYCMAMSELYKTLAIP